jgi:protein SCO1/2
MSSLEGSPGTTADASHSLPLAGDQTPRLGALAALLALVVLAACGRAPAPAASFVGGPFHLIDQDGRAVDQSILNGRWTAVYFGYTFCPDACPMTLTALAQAQAKLRPSARGFRVVFITVDPARDTPAQMKTYLASPAFPPGALGLTGSPAQITEAARAYRVYYRKAGAGSDYSVDHSSVIYLMDPAGRFRAPIDAQAPPTTMASQIKAAIAQG